MQTNHTLNILSKFRQVDKYESFHEILPAVIYTNEEQKKTVTELLDICCATLIDLYETSKKPSKIIMKKVLVQCMDELSIASIDAENREFGYQLGWYLAEKVNINLRKGTEKKIWGYWSIEANEVKPPVRPRISGKSKAKAQKKADHTSITTVQ